MHGDLYGHNILHCGQGRVVVGDFGAASFYPFKDASCAVSLERLEVRAFGCLLEELVGRINQDLRSTVLLVQLTTLIAACLCEIPAKRPLFAEIEQELADLDDADKREFLADLGLDEPGLNRLIRAGYDLLGLQTYFTAGVKEVRAWTIHKGDTAPKAAGVIHTDFERGFIRAQTISYADFIACNGEQGAKEKGKMRAEGKEYIVQDGDVMNFLFNV